MGDNLNYDVQKLIQLLYRAKGDYTFHKYAKICDIDPSYISRIVNQRVSNPPHPDTLKKIANNAHNDVTYEDLMRASGYWEDISILSEHQQIIRWANDPDNFDYIKFIYDAYKTGITKELLAKIEMTIKLR